MSHRLFLQCLATSLGVCLLRSALGAAETLPGTQPLALTGDLSAQMVAGIDKFLDRELEASIASRAQFWKRDFSSPEAYAKSVTTNRARLAEILGLTERIPAGSEFQIVGGTVTPSRVAETERYVIHAVRWPVLEGVQGEGLLLEPKTTPRANIIALPDADVTPEQLCGLAVGVAPEQQFARRLAEHGCRVLVPVLLNRDTTGSSDPIRGRATNLPHREWIWRMAFEVGRNPIGYEIQKVLAAADIFGAPNSSSARAVLETGAPVGVIGHGEGGLLALCTAALDPRIRATVVSGYFDSRQRVWAEPTYRTAWSFLKEFGDAELASLIAPRSLIVEYAPSPHIEGPPKAGAGRRNCAAPGTISTPGFPAVEAEVERARQLAGKFGNAIQFVHGSEGTLVGQGSPRALSELLKALGTPVARIEAPAAVPVDARVNFDPDPRQLRQVKELEDHTQRILQRSELTRAAKFWNTIKATNAAGWEKLLPPLRKQFDEQVMGKWSNARLPLNPRSRPGVDSTNALLAAASAPYAAWDVTLDVFPDVSAWGALLLPKDLKPGERRPVVVCQHGLEGLPEHCITDDKASGAYRAYKAFAARLAERGFVVFTPHNPYRGQDAFRVLQRKSWLLGRHLFSTIHAQHDAILDWLEAQPFVDPKRIAFYGLSYGGKSAMRIPAALTDYCLSICSADFNEWVRKCVSLDMPMSYVYTGEYEIWEWNLGRTFNYAEMAALIAPRPFMVERGHNDGVGVDEWVSYEYAKVRRLYDKLGIGNRTQIEYFEGPHTINGKGTFEFLRKHLRWPKAK